MAKLVNMKIDRSAKQEKEASSVALDAPAYPYGLEIRLDDDALEKLGLDAGDLAVGEKRLLTAKVEITSVSSNQSKGGGSYQNVSLQITALCLEGDEKPAAALYKE